MHSILITGGAGFIGSHLTKKVLEAGHRVRILDNLSQQIHGNKAYSAPSGAEIIVGDVTVRRDLKRALQDVDTVVHLAAETGTGQSMYEIERYYRVNVQGTALLFDILANQQHGVRNVVLASSRSVYGEGAYLCRTCGPAGVRRFPAARTPQQLARHEWTSRCPECHGELEATGTRENDPVDPASVYAATKLAQEEMVRVTCRALGLAHAILRFQNVFGEGQSLSNPYTGILSIFSTRIRLGQSLPIFEDGEETRDFVHVEDVAAVLQHAIEQPVAEGVTVNVGSGEPISVMAIAQLLVKVMGADISPHVTGEYRVGDIRHNYADITRLSDAFGFSPMVPIEQGMRRFADWVQKQPVPEDLLDRANAELKARKLMA
jgi:dTDP-L-rhamnose 4-epimerase